MSTSISEYQEILKLAIARRAESVRRAAVVLGSATMLNTAMPQVTGLGGGCGEKFKHLLVTANGDTWDKPTGIKPWASSADVTAWLAVAAKVFKMQRAQWDALMEFENSRQDWTETRRIRGYLTSYEDDYWALPEASWTTALGGADDELVQIVANAVAGACAMDVLAEGIRRSGMVAPTVPDLRPPLISGTQMVIAGAVAVIGAGAYAFVKLSPAGLLRRMIPGRK